MKRIYSLLKIVLLFSMLLSGNVHLTAQVTIGSTLPPVSGALLELKENDPDANNATAKKGLLLPRVTLSSLTDFNTIVPGASQTDKKDHNGLLVYNIGDSRVCSGIHIWNEVTWDRYPKVCQVNTLCGSIVVTGIYRPGIALDATHTITLYIEVPKEATKGGTYTLSTDTQNGMTFSATGNMEEGKKQITLQGVGTPTTIGTFSFTLTGNYSNSVSAPLTCTVPITVYILKSVKIFGFGYNAGTYGYHTESSGSRKVLTTPKNYGATVESTVKTEAPTFPTPLTVDGIGTAFVNSAGFQSNPDIIINGYHSHAPNDANGDAAINALVQYLKDGGILILNDENKDVSNITARICRKLFASSTISVVSMGPSGSIYPINPAIDDEITNGPFGDIRGLYWGNDASTTAGITGLPENEIIAYSRNVVGGGATTAVTMFRLKNYNLFFVGDGGFISNPNSLTGNTYPGYPYYCPFSMDATFAPIPRVSFGGSSATVYNSQLFANLIYWSMLNSKANK